MTKKENEILSRRSFFKKAAGIVIPAVAMVALPSVMTSCEIDEEYPDVPTGCTGSSCKNGCKTGCQGSCYTHCQVICKGSCGYNCKGTARHV